MVKTLVNLKADLEDKNEQGYTWLMIAAEGGYIGLVETLMN